MQFIPIPNSNLILMDDEKLQSLIDVASEKATLKAIEKFEELRSKETSLTTNQIAEKQGVDRSTVEKWCRDGLKGVKLKYTRPGGRVYSITLYDLNEFKRKVNI